MYPVKIELSTEPRFPEYDLHANPFPVLAEDEGSKLDELGAFWAACSAKEANRLWWELIHRIADDEPIGLWLLRDKESSGASNTETLVRLMKKIASEETGHLLMLYMPLQVAYENLLKGIARTLADRLIPTDFRKCFYEFAADRVGEAATDPSAAEQLSSFDNVEELEAQLRDPKNSGIHKFLFPTAAEQTKERHVLRKSQVEEAQDEEEVAELAAARERIAKVWEQRRQLTAFLERKLSEGDWGEGVCQTMRRVFETSSFVQARNRLTDVVDYRGSLAGLFRFLRHRFAKVVILIDQVQAFEAFTETERATFYGALGEFDVIGGPNARWMFASFPETVDLIGKRKLASFDMMPLELSVTREAEAAPIPPKAFTELVRQFVASDPLRPESASKTAKNKSGGLSPFDQKTVEEALSATNGNCLKAAGLLGRLLERAHEAGVKKIDSAFVAKHASVAAEAATAPAEAETGPSAD